jgi:probable HAF family extracellular repeat protein
VKSTARILKCDSVWKSLLVAMSVCFLQSGVASGAIMMAVYWDQSGGLHALGSAESTALAINKAGWIVGGSGNHAALWKDGQLTDLGVLPGDDISLATGINTAGIITGYSSLGGNNTHFFLYDGSMHDLGPGGATGINDLGQVIGYSSVGFVWPRDHDRNRCTGGVLTFWH